MEEVVGKRVVHKIFGRGNIVLADTRYFTVQFENLAVGEKKFLFPQAFDSILVFEDGDLQAGARAAAEQAAADRQNCAAKIAIRCKQEALLRTRKKIARRARTKK